MKNIRFFNRALEREDENLQIKNLSNDDTYRSLQPFPGYNYETFPYILVKDSKSLNVINVRSMQSRVIVKDSPYYHDVVRTSMMDFQKNPDDPKTVTLFNLEQFSKRIVPEKATSISTSTIRKLNINLENLDSCFM